MINVREKKRWGIRKGNIGDECDQNALLHYMHMEMS
jgi:hypothetical protein